MLYPMLISLKWRSVYWLYPPLSNERNEIQDILWADTALEIPKRFRREVARALGVEDLYHNAREFDAIIGAKSVSD